MENGYGLFFLERKLAIFYDISLILRCKLLFLHSKVFEVLMCFMINVMRKFCIIFNYIVVYCIISNWHFFIPLEHEIMISLTLDGI